MIDILPIELVTRSLNHIMSILNNNGKYVIQMRSVKPKCNAYSISNQVKSESWSCPPYSASIKNKFDFETQSLKL